MLCGPEQEETGRRIAAALGDRSAGVLAEARMHVPVEVADRARDRARELGADGCVAVGGGSAIGLGKAVALEHGLPVIAVPTTYAGSEMTPVWGLTEGGQKRTGRDPRVLPTSVIYDPELTLSLPVAMSVTSGMNAVAHAVEALYAPDATPIISLMAEEGVRALAGALPPLVATAADLDARSRAQYGAWLCGAVPGRDHDVAAPQALPRPGRHARPAARADPHRGAAARAGLQPAGGARRGGRAVPRPGRGRRPGAAAVGPRRRARAPRVHCASSGMAEADIPRIVEQVLANPYANPVEVTEPGLTRLLRRAWAGDPPAA